MRTIPFLCLLLWTAVDVDAQTTSRSKVSQFGITWTFDKAYPAGQFATGDWWVVGPVKIVKIDPPSVSGGRVMHGSMINPPAPGTQQGYDSAMRHTSYGGNVAVNVSSSNPLTVKPHSSLLSARSHPTASHRPALLDMAILTVLPSKAPAGAFRPPYCGTDKTIKFNKSQLDYSFLARVKKTSKTWDLSRVEKLFERPWPDHIQGWPLEHFAPIRNMKNYGRDITADVGVGALSLQLDYTNAQKEKLLTRMVQIGIDTQGVLDAGGTKNWRDSGYGHGRKLLILIAGMALKDAKMKGVGARKDYSFAEDLQTFYVAETSPGVYNWGHGGYNSSHKGMPEWGSRHGWAPQYDKQWGLDPYRFCCSANGWVGYVLAARMMKLQPLWNHNALFDYQDRYLKKIRSGSPPGWTVSWVPWALEMWDAYRSKY